MPIHYQIDPGRRELLAWVSGVVSDGELFDAVERILKDPLLPQAPRVIWDAREREDVPFSMVIEPILDLLHAHELTLRGAKCALVSSRAASFGMQRMFTFRSDSMPIEIQAFRDLEEARSWLDDSSTDDAT